MLEAESISISIQGVHAMEDLLEMAMPLFKKLVQRYGSAAVIQYIDKTTDVAGTVTLAWMSRERVLSSGLQKIILGCLRGVRPGDFPLSITAPGIPITAIRCIDPGSAQKKTHLIEG